MDADRPICHATGGEGAAAVSFRRHAPPPELREFVETLWTFDAAPGGEALTDYILPDFGTEIICRMEGQAFLRGPRRQLEEIAIEPGTRYVGARLRPGIGPRLFRLAARDTCGSRLALEDMGCLVAASSRKDFTRALVDLFRRRGLAGNGIARGAVDIIARPQGRISVQAVATALGCSPRHLYREMMAHLGMGPKTVARIARLRHAIALVTASDASLADLAIVAGFADQAHMTREFAHLRVPSPARLRQWR